MVFVLKYQRIGYPGTRRQKLSTFFLGGGGGGDHAKYCLSERLDMPQSKRRYAPVLESAFVISCPFLLYSTLPQTAECKRIAYIRRRQALSFICSKRNGRKSGKRRF